MGETAIEKTPPADIKMLTDFSIGDLVELQNLVQRERDKFIRLRDETSNKDHREQLQDMVEYYNNLSKKILK